MEIRRAEEKEGQTRSRGNRRSRDELLDLYAECLAVTTSPRQFGDGATLH
jgi:hypothetical protein